jgi:hypothetical protein
MGWLSLKVSRFDSRESHHAFEFIDFSPRHKTQDRSVERLRGWEQSHLSLLVRRHRGHTAIQFPEFLRTAREAPEKSAKQKQERAHRREEKSQREKTHH